MDQATINCVPHPQHITWTRTPIPLAPFRLHWQACQPQPFIEDLLAQLEEVPGGQLTFSLQTAKHQPTGGDEGYELSASAQGTRIEAASTAGLIYGAATLLQLSDNQTIRNITHIVDSPRYGWRGLLIDPARHFFSIALLKRVIDGMTRLKMNVLHLHLSDDQAFRMQSLAYPKLHSAQHYTQTELRDLVHYASERGIRVVPEIDIPGHVNAWLVAYPEWGCQAVTPTESFGVHKACLNPANESVYEALRMIFREVASIFDDDYIHIGGDEVHIAWWRDDPDVQAFMAENGFADLNALQNHFTTRVVSILGELGKKAIGWDEVLHDPMPSMVVQNWRGMTTRDRIGACKLPCIISAPFYLDLNYPADMHYAYDLAMPQKDAIALEDSQQQDPRLAHVAEGIGWTHQWRKLAIHSSPQTNILGGEACLWSEIVDEGTLETRLWSRLPAVAERLWSLKTYADFSDRLDNLLDSPAFCHRTRQQEALSTLGLSNTQIEIALLLEPVKWYARLLGKAALEARLQGNEMPKARPYQVNTPLNRIVDYISPESRSAASLQRASPADWEALSRSVLEQDVSHWPDDTRPVMEAFKCFAQCIDNDDATAAATLYVPHGEYMIAAIPAWLAFRATRSH